MNRRDAEAPLFLVGFMGVGKTTAGRALSRRLGWDFEDTDGLVEAVLGCAVETVFRQFGEGRFREAEWDALRSLGGRRRVVVATGGGLFLGVPQRAFVRANGWSCWLDAPLHVVAARLGTGGTRPLFETEDALSRRSMFERRRATYALADARVDAASGDADDLARSIETCWRVLWR